jgi:DNA-binding NarL/FixJ family response regulator
MESSLGRPLSSRELTVLHLAARGLTSDEIGAELGISEATAKKHIASLLHKLGAANRAELIAKAAATGLLSEPS